MALGKLELRIHHVNDTTNEWLSRKGLMNDPHRPRYHFLPPANWMNDPNGLLYWKGQYHLFYQYNPYAPIPQRLHWGHAVSADLVHWTDLPVALTPIPGRADASGCWSGSAIDHDGIPTLLYSAAHPQVVCLATSNDDLLTWHYYPRNPVISGPPAELLAGTGGNFRDPFVWKEGDCWYLLIGSKREGMGGLILLYRSSDLTTWEYLHPLLVGGVYPFLPEWMGVMWECPNLLTFGDQRVLIFSVQNAEEVLLYPVYVTGTFENEQFLPNTQGIVASGGSFYAPQVLRDNQGRYIMWGWLMEDRGNTLSQAAGWSGVMSLPIIVGFLPGGQLSLEPAPELAVLRERHWHYEELMVDEAHHFSLDESRGDCLEILTECEPDSDSEFGFTLRCSPDGQEQTCLVYQSELRLFSIECEQSSVNPEVDRRHSSVVVPTGAEKRVTFHIFLDHSVIEVFVNDQCYLASRIYPERFDSLGLNLLIRKGSVLVKSLDIWHLASIWNR